MYANNNYSDDFELHPLCNYFKHTARGNMKPIVSFCKVTALTILSPSHFTTIQSLPYFLKQSKRPDRRTLRNAPAWMGF